MMDYPCPCPGCDGETLMADEYCAECMHEGCEYGVSCRD